MLWARQFAEVVTHKQAALAQHLDTFAPLNLLGDWRITLGEHDVIAAAGCSPLRIAIFPAPMSLAHSAYRWALPALAKRWVGRVINVDHAQPTAPERYPWASIWKLGPPTRKHAAIS
jgi:hypothetical protein